MNSQIPQLSSTSENYYLLNCSKIPDDSQYVVKLGSFFTNWSFVVIIITFVFFLIQFLLIKMNQVKQLNHFIVVLIVFTISNSTSVFITSQLLLTFDVDYNETANGIPVDGLMGSSIETLNKINFYTHTLPFLVALFMLFGLLKWKRYIKINRNDISAYVFLLFCIFYGLYLLVPVQSLDGSNVFGFSKISLVYENPSGYIILSSIIIFFLMLWFQYYLLK